MRTQQKRKRLSPQEIFEIMSERHANEFLEASSPHHFIWIFFFIPILTPTGKKKFQWTKEVLLWWKAIINFFGCLHLLFFLSLEETEEKKKRDNFLHVRAEQLLFVFGKINCIPRELISEVIYVGTSLGGGHNIYVANIHAANGCYPRRICVFLFLSYYSFSWIMQKV